MRDDAIARLLLWVFIVGTYVGIVATLLTGSPNWAAGAAAACLVYIVVVTVGWRP